MAFAGAFHPGGVLAPGDHREVGEEGLKPRVFGPGLGMFTGPRHGQMGWLQPLFVRNLGGPPSPLKWFLVPLAPLARNLRPTSALKNDPPNPP